MTPQQKANSIYNQMFDQIHKGRHYSDYQLDIVAAKDCALIAVQEILNALHLDYGDGRLMAVSTKTFDYWQQVKEAIQNHKP